VYNPGWEGEVTREKNIVSKKEGTGEKEEGTKGNYNQKTFEEGKS